MNNKEEIFLQYYIASGLNASRKAELYRLAFGTEVKGIKDSSLETYAKRLLAQKESKDFIKKHRPNDLIRSEQLLDAIKELQELLIINTKVSDVLAIRREIRLHLADLAKCVDVVEGSKGNNEWKVLGDSIKLTVPIDASEPKALSRYINGLTNSKESVKILIVMGKEIKEMIPLSIEEDGVTAEEMYELLMQEEFGIALKVG